MPRRHKPRSRDRRTTATRYDLFDFLECVTASDERSYGRPATATEDALDLDISFRQHLKERQNGDRAETARTEDRTNAAFAGHFFLLETREVVSISVMRSPRSFMRY